MDKKLLKKTLNELNTPCKIYAFEEIESTNLTAKEYARQGEKEFTLVISDSQTNGRGRLGRSFFSPNASGIYLSIIVRPRFTFEDAFPITPAAAVGVTKALEENYGISPQIKWVNDVYVASRKVCGILTESSFTQDGITDWAVIGIGINLTAPEKGFPNDINNIAGALFEKSNAPLKEVFAAQIVSSVINIYKTLPETGFIQEYQSKSYLTGKTVELPDKTLARVIGIDARCGLVVEFPDKSIKTITSSDVSVKISSPN